MPHLSAIRPREDTANQFTSAFANKSTRSLPVTSSTLGWSSRPNSQNGNPSKINPEKVACFSSPNPDHQLPSFHQQSTTTSPQKNHAQPPIFVKTPSKNSVPPPTKNSAKASPLQAGFWPLRGKTTAVTATQSTSPDSLSPCGQSPPA